MDPLFLLVLGTTATVLILTWLRRRRGAVTEGAARNVMIGTAIVFGVLAGIAIAPTHLVLGWIVFGLFAYPAFGILIGRAAEQKGKSFWAFFWLTILASPILMWVIVAILPDQMQISTPTENPSQASTESLSSELARLAELHKAGALTDDEFAKAKSQALRSD